MKDGIYEDLPEDDYHALPRLSASGIKHLLVSPMDFWRRSWLNPKRKIVKKKAFEIGKAYDKMLIDGSAAFKAMYAMPFDEDEFEDALDTVQDLKEECASLLLAVGGNKSELIQRLRDNGCDKLIIQEEKDKWLAATEGLCVIPASDYESLMTVGDYMEAQPNNPFRGGKSQISVLWTDEETGVPMKSRYDYLKDRLITDLKTFSNIGEFPINLAVSRAVATYKYHIQSAVYLDSHKIMFKTPAKFQFVFVNTGDTVLAVGKRFINNSLLHQVGHMAYRRGVETFAEYYRKFGNRPWIDDLSMTDLHDDEMPGYVFD